MTEEKLKKIKRVSKEEFENFIKSYPNPLEGDFFMDWYSYNDFTKADKWPDSMVAKEYHMYGTDIYEIYI